MCHDEYVDEFRKLPIEVQNALCENMGSGGYDMYKRCIEIYRFFQSYFNSNN